MSWTEEGKDHFFVCGCKDHYLILSVDYWGKGEISVELSLATHVPSPDRKLGLLSRLKEAWRAFKLGQPYSEIIFFEKLEDFDKLVEQLNVTREYWTRKANEDADQL